MKGMPRLAATYEWTAVVYELRSRRSESQADFAAVVGCSESTVSKWEQGRSDPQFCYRKTLEGVGAKSGYLCSQWSLKA